MTNAVPPIQTRISNSFVTPVAKTVSSGLLVKIYPLASIGHPVPFESLGLVIGRDSNCSLAIDDDSVSRRHATVEWKDDGYVVRDLGSTNGTFVNDQRVQEQKLSAGDRVRFGKNIFKYLSATELESQYHETVFKMMTTDGLTEVYNKRYFAENLERDLLSLARTQESLCVLLMDLDKFKSVNDTFGHLAGDAVLIEFAKRAKSVVRCGELFARYGGEEFVMMCPRARLSEAAATAERIRAVVSAAPVEFEGMVIPLTVSIGIAQCDASYHGDMNDLLSKADQYLYRAKELGRNQVQFEGKNS